MPLKFESLVTLWQQYQIYFILSFVLVGLTLIAVVTTVIALRKARRLKTPATNTALQGKSHLAPSEKKTQNENATPHGIKRTKLAVGDVANPWTQAVYERHSPEGKIDALLPPFAFDEHGGIHRLAFPDAVKGIDIERALQYTDTAAGLAVNGAYAVFLLWHAGDARYAAYALKVASHAQIAPEQKNLVRFLFQDVIEKRVSIFDVPGIERWSKPAFRAAVTLYTAPKISEERGGELEKVLPTALSRFYELTLAQKLPIKIIYRKAATNP
ncbi:MAG TPA: hypothetical protein PLY93_07805, partial [Turneriella sp.]|nr:hypothetical protein [Turneriella sp.]